jgi:hypothetical protein
MNYFVARNGQTYGPYSLETVRKYLSEGSMLASDVARTDEMTSWATLGEVVPDPPPPPPNAGVIAPQQAAQAYPPPRPANIPPSLHWALVLLFGLLTSGVFITIWAFVEAIWVRNIDPASRATRDLVYAIVMPILGAGLCAILLVMGGASLSMDNRSVVGASSFGMAFLVFFGFAIGGVVFHIKAFFGIRASMERYYNTVEPINLRLSAVMTLFFNVLYFQYHMTRIADWKQTGVLRP